MAGQTSLHIRRAIGGDDESVGWVVRHLSPLLQLAARSRLRGQLQLDCDADDLVQDVWIRALPQLRRIRPRAGRWTPPLIRYLNVTLWHRRNDFVRAAIRRQRGLGSPTPLDAVDVPEETLGMLQRAERDERARGLRAALDQLPAGQRELLLARGLDQLEYRVIAEQTGETAECLRKRYERTLDRLRSTLPAWLAKGLAD